LPIAIGPTARGFAARALIVSATLSVVAACASSAFSSTYRAPDAQAVSLEGKRVVAIIPTRNEAFRQRAEDALASRISGGGTKCVPGYTLFPGDDLKDREKVRAKLEEAGFDGAIIMRVAERGQHEVTQDNPSYNSPAYGSFWGYWSTSGNPLADPAVTSNDPYAVVETRVYSLKPDKLIWAGTTKRQDAQNIERLVRETVDKVADELRKEDLLK
jgi:hypothetical protein